MTKIKAITFDLWNTLLRNKSNVFHDNILNYITSNLGKNFEQTMYSQYQTIDDFYNYFKQVCGHTKLKHLQAMIKKHCTKNFTEFSDFQYVLPLMKKYKLGIISNSSFITEECLKHWGYTKIFDFVILSYKYETSKPDKKINTICSNKLSIKPSNILHIGDSYTSDFLGAKNSGFNALLLDRKNMHKEIKERITSFKQLENYLEKKNKE